MKKIKIVLVSLICFALSLIGLLSVNLIGAFAEEDNVQMMRVDELSRQLFGDVKIESIEYLYNYDEQPDYLYVNYCDYGYAVFLREGLNLLEYAPDGELPYTETKGKKIYGGPTNYFEKEDEQYIDVVSGESFSILTSEANNFADNLRNTFKNELILSNKKIDEDFLENSADSINDYDRNNPPEADPPGAADTKYISNYEYFLNSPIYGNNTTGTCVAVAAQILLTYNNYFNDRRIIDNKFLYGSETDPEKNPNFCTDPTSMTPYTIGSKSEPTGDDSYYAYVLSYMPKGISDRESAEKLKSILNKRNQEINGVIDFNVEYHNATFDCSGRHLDSSYVIKEIESDRPLIICFNTNNDAHDAVGYGYQNMNDDFGYIVNYGWNGLNYFGDDDFSNRWINSVWCVSSVSLQINHTHNYVGVELFNSKSMEVKCVECGHRNVTDLFKYDVNEKGNIEILGLNYSNVEEITVPRTINNILVTDIKEKAFVDCKFLKRVYISDNITKIGFGAFMGCDYLEEISLPYVGGYAFVGASSANTHFGYIFGASSYNYNYKYVPHSLTTVTVGGKWIEPYAFYGCSSIISLTINNDITRIGQYAFSGCTFWRVSFKHSYWRIHADGSTQTLVFAFGSMTASDAAKYVRRYVEYIWEAM